MGEYMIAHVWHLFPPPARPSPGELKLIRRELLNLKRRLRRKLDILVLGSTIEYRLLGAELGFNVSCIDFSRKNYDVLSRQTDLKLEEHFIQSDWLEMDFNSRFDVILGDHVLNMLLFPEYSELLSRAKRACRTGGLVILKNMYLVGGAGQKLKRLLARHAFQPREYSFFSYVWAELYSLFISDGLVNYKRTRRYAKGLLQQKRIRKRDYELMEFLMSFETRLSMPTREFLRRKLLQCGYRNLKWLSTGEEITREFPLIVYAKN